MRGHYHTSGRHLHSFSIADRLQLRAGRQNCVENLQGDENHLRRKTHVFVGRYQKDRARLARVGLAKGFQARTVGEAQVHDADASSEPGCSRDQKQPCPDDDGPGGSRDALTGRCETFDGDGCRHDSHRAKVHDPET